MTENRQRAPFYHASSSADLTSPESLNPPRGFPPSSSRHAPPLPHSNSHGQENGSSVHGLWKEESPYSINHPTNHLHHQNHHDEKQMLGGNSNGYLHPVGPIYNLDTPSPDPHRRITPSPTIRSRSPSPNPFRIPTFSFPEYKTLRFMSLCTLWYACSALSSNTGKVILNHFRYPVTLTIVQFFFVAAYCVICSRPEFGWTGRLRAPTKAIVKGTLPMAVFQVGGHIFSSLAISRVPVSTVHTIKALSPLFTVAAYALLFGVSYSPATYLSLLPLTLGVMLACSFDVSVSNILGLVCAFGSTLIFVSQNIFFKKIMPTNAESATGLPGAPRLDKINLLYFSSGLAFILMIPVWLWNDAFKIFNDWPTSHSAPSIPLYFFLNGTVHFAQNLLAFAILSSTSPVTYSIASLVKRIAVICLAIIWFNQIVHPIQAVGIGLTAIGLWMYNNAKRDVEKGERRMRQVEATRDSLPISKTSRGGDEKVPPGTSILGLFGISRNPPYPPHASPRPTYPANFAHGSHSSALRNTNYYTSQPMMSKPSSIALSEAVYPSPPPSADITPPNETVTLPPPLVNQATRHRISGEERAQTPGENYRVNPGASSGRPISPENEKRVGNVDRDRMPPPIKAS